MKYDDNYETCEKTHASLRIYSDIISPKEITKRLGMSSTSSMEKGKPFEGDTTRKCTTNGWFIETKGIIDSKDSRRHIDYIADLLMPVKSELHKLITEDITVDISCYWLSLAGHSGPTLSPSQMKKLSELEIEVWFDVYFVSNDD